MEILENTLIRLISRQGADSDRRNTLLNSGEFGYAQDIRRLFIGNGFSNGGDVVGNKFAGQAVDITTLSPAIVGDFAYDTDHKKLYQLQSNDGSLITDWSLIGGVYSSGDGYISIDINNAITLKPLSANSLSRDLVSGNIIIDSGRLALSGIIPYQLVSTKTVTISSGLKASIDGIPINGPVNTLSSNLIIQTNSLYAIYDGLSGQILRSGYNRNITSVTRLSAGDYIFNYGPLDTEYVYPIVQIYGNDLVNCQARTITANNSACNINVLSSNYSKHDANIILTISY